MSDAELANLLKDCLKVWGVRGRVAAAKGGVAVSAEGITCTVGRAPASQRRGRWLLCVNDGVNGDRSRPASSVAILLSELRAALGADAPAPQFRVALPS